MAVVYSRMVTVIVYGISQLLKVKEVGSINVLTHRRKNMTFWSNAPGNLEIDGQ